MWYSTEAYKQGEAAGRDNKEAISCPYEVHTTDFYRWHDGFRAGGSDRRSFQVKTWLEQEKKRDELVNKAYEIIKGREQLKWPSMETAWLEDDGVHVTVSDSRCGCCQPEIETFVVAWSEVL